jgi:hypothetical protein
MKNFKTKSFSAEFTESNILDKSCGRRFITFEAAIRHFTERYNLNDKPIGYNITEEGIEILYK